VTISHSLPLSERIDTLARFGDAPAIVLADRILTHGQLDALVTERADVLGSTRRLVLVEAANELDPLVSYLAALRGGHPVLLVPERSGAGSRHWDRVLSTYRPDVVAGRGDDGWELTEIRAGTAHDLHPDLALLLGTSGSTGTPKLVRLSHENLIANAAAIGGYLGLGAHSRAATTLPMQYCYGLSVVNSHLLAGGSLWLTDASVVDPGFFADFTRAGATSFAGVPYTFDLLESSGQDWTATPGLRQVTQAGGRLAPEKVRELAVRSARDEVEFVVMYGQTEATARMAYLPADMAADRPGCIGVPIEGGEFRLDEGELVYSGPNVMLGYAETAADLALGRTTAELRTGDLAIQHDDGLYEIVGRRNRMAKLFGVRLDLDLVESLLGEHGVEARAVATADRLSVLVTSPSDLESVREVVLGEHCLPRHAVAVTRLDEVPLTATGKTDYAALLERAAGVPTDTPGDVVAAFAGVFGTVAPEDSFTSLRGDSLCYVELYVRLERILGDVPAGWPTLTVAELAARRPHRRRWLAWLETPIVLRAVAIVLIVLGHTDIVNVLGGAHLLLVALGYNLARFALDRPSRRERIRSLGAAVRDIAIPCSLWVAGATVVSHAYDWSTAVYLTNWLHPQHWNHDWRLWFVEAVVWALLALIAITSLRPVDRALRRSPYLVALGVLALGLVLRLATPGVGILTKYTVPDTFWLVALGWVVAGATTTGRRLFVSALVPLTMIGYFGDDLTRSGIVVAGTWLLIWVPRLPIPRLLQGLFGLLASASLFIYLTHWQVYSPLKYQHPWLAFAASMALGIAVYAIYTPLRRTLGAHLTASRHARRPID
jgi:acyl-CoA synthetase (AMP-forming)/AMP-acid ligase II